MTAAFVALLVLGLLPGLLVVRAPWTVTPALSLAFWALSAWWPPASATSRQRLLLAGLVASALLAALRLLPKHEVPPPPGWVPPPEAPPPSPPGLPPSPLASRASFVVLAVALAVLAPAARHRHAPGARMAFQTTSARLLVWRDAIPRSAEPLLPLAPFGAHAPAFASLAADVSHLSGVDPAASVLLILCGSASLMLLGSFALAGTGLPPPRAALAAVAGAALLGWAPVTALWGGGEALLGLGFLLPALALLLGRASRASAVAAGLLFAAGLLAQPLLTLLAVVGCGARLLLCRGSSGSATRRLALALAAAALLGGPGLRPALGALSLGELGAVLTAAAARDAVVFTVSLVALGLVASGVRRMTAGRAGPGPALLLAATLGSVLAVVEDVRVGGGQLGAERQRALESLARSTDPLAVVCAPADSLDWVPALAGRAAGEPGPWVPPAYRDEWLSRRRRPCGADPVTSFHVLDRNLEPSRAYN